MLNSSRDLLVAFGSVRKKERKREERQREGKKREKVKERESFIAVTWSRKKHREKNPPGREGVQGRHQNRCNTQYKSFCGNLILSNFGHSQEGFSSPVPETKCSVSKSLNGRILKSWIPKVTCSQKIFTIGNFYLDASSWTMCSKTYQSKYITLMEMHEQNMILSSSTLQP